jgi:hypothetical protein
MTEPTPVQQALASDLKDLGLTSIGGRVLEGRISVQRALSHVKREHGVKQRMLDLKAGRGSVGAIEMRERLATWCEKAKFTLEHWSDYLEPES